MAAVAAGASKRFSFTHNNRHFFRRLQICEEGGEVMRWAGQFSLYISVDRSVDNVKKAYRIRVWNTEAK